MSRKMKDSGVEWIGEIPQHWEVRRVKDGFIRKKSEAHQENPIVLSLARTGVKVRDLSKNEGQIAESYYNYNPVEPGDLLLNPMDLYSGANCSIANVEGVISPAYINLKAKKGYNPQFYDYYFKTQYWTMAMFAHGKGVSFDNRWTLGLDDLLNYNIPVPDKMEQDRISMYLENKCLCINKIIKKTYLSINEYQKMKKVIITDLVTCGIECYKSMTKKESVGKIPEGWKIVRLKFLMSDIVDCPHETPNYTSDGKYLVIRTADQDYAKIRTDKNMYRLSENEYNNRIRRMALDKNDIVYGREGERWGLACLVPKSNKYCLGQRMMQFRCKEKLIKPQFAVYALSSMNVRRQGEVDTLGSTSPHVNISTIRNYSILLPPLCEQEKIVNYLDEKCNKIDMLIEQKEKIITELEEYKRSLIYEHVTGKKEVPEY